MVMPPGISVTPIVQYEDERPIRPSTASDLLMIPSGQKVRPNSAKKHTQNKWLKKGLPGHVDERPIQPAQEYAQAAAAESALLIPDTMGTPKQRPNSARKNNVRNLNESMTSLSARNAGIKEPTTKVR